MTENLVQIAISLDELHANLEAYAFHRVEEAADGSGWHIAYFSGPTEGAAWQRVADALMPLVKAAQCEPRKDPGNE